MGSSDSGGYVKFTPKYIIMGGEGGYQNIFFGCNLISLVTEGRMQSFRTLVQEISGEK